MRWAVASVCSKRPPISWLRSLESPTCVESTSRIRVCACWPLESVSMTRVCSFCAATCCWALAGVVGLVRRLLHLDAVALDLKLLLLDGALVLKLLLLEGAALGHAPLDDHEADSRNGEGEEGGKRLGYGGGLEPSR